VLYCGALCSYLYSVCDGPPLFFSAQESAAVSFALKAPFFFPLEDHSVSSEALFKSGRCGTEVLPSLVLAPDGLFPLSRVANCRQKTR